MKLSDFDYELPRELIAQYPCEVRGESRLLVADRQTGCIEHRQFSDITQYLRAGDSLILNNTKVVPCRLLGRRSSGGKAEVFLLKRLDASLFSAFIKPSRIRHKEVLVFAHGLKGTVEGKNSIRFHVADAADVYRSGSVPLPPYIKRQAEKFDEDRYQTVYAENPGALAAPTAGLHFTTGLLDRIRACGVHVAELTLHTGSGTFKPVKAADIDEHVMDAESFCIPGETRELIAHSRRLSRRIIAAGTTTVRALETYAARDFFQGETDVFLRPGHRFALVDALLTNFHLPRTTLLILVHAFAGSDLARKAYAEAVRLRYRFYSYGDAMLIL